MKMCSTHWEALREAIGARGLYDLVAKSPEEATKNTVRQPLMAATNMIYGNAIQAGGMEILCVKEDGAEHCPICFLQVSDWIEAAAAGVKRHFDENLKG